MRTFPLACVALLLLTVETRADSGIYVRGDLGIALGTESTESDTNPGARNASLPNQRIVGGMDNSFTGGVGIGYRITPLFRVEASYTHVATALFKGNFVPGVGSATGKVDSEVGLVSGYFDAAPLAGPLPLNLQPFVTLGLGITYNNTHTETDLNATGAVVNFFSGAIHHDLAWSAGAGVGLPVGDSVVFDLTYRYLDLGERRTGTQLISPAGVTTGVLTPDRANLQVHTVTVGARILF